MFSNRVMQALLETGHIRHELTDHEPGEMSVRYAYLLSNLLRCDSASVNLKAAICRMVITDKEIGARGQARCLAEGCMSLFRDGSVFVATYACAALVNLAQSYDTVKGHLISVGVVEACTSALKSRDSDLMLYTLMLLVHLTKRSHHRSRINQVGFVETLHEIFLHTYKHVPRLRRLLSEVCSVIGQFCNDSDTRLYFNENGLPAKILDMVDSALRMDREPGSDLPETSTKILAKAYFALKQLIGNSPKLKDEITDRMVQSLIQDLKSPANSRNHDYASNAIMLLCALTTKRNNKKMYDAGWPEAYQTLIASNLASIDVMRGRIEHLASVTNPKTE